MRDESTTQLMRLLLQEKGVPVPDGADAETLVRLTLEVGPAPESLPHDWAGILAEIFDAASDSLPGDVS